MSDSPTPVPVLPLSAAIIAFVNGTLPVFTAFGLELSGEQVAAIQTFTNSAVLFVLAISHYVRAARSDRERWSHMNGNAE